MPMTNHRPGSDRGAITPPCYPITAGPGARVCALLLNSIATARNFPPMKKHITPLTLILVALMAAQPALADCTVKYKAKQDNPLKLEAGKVTLSGDACNSAESAANAVAAMLAEKGWTLLAIVDIRNKG
ncbi:MAG: hypothetical protein WBA91_10220 [Paracoccaceae bacterium]